jgi:hypothetical protein
MEIFKDVFRKLYCVRHKATEQLLNSYSIPNRREFSKILLFMFLKSWKVGRKFQFVAKMAEHSIINNQNQSTFCSLSLSYHHNSLHNFKVYLKQINHLSNKKPLRSEENAQNVNRLRATIHRVFQLTEYKPKSFRYKKWRYL